MGMPLQGQLLPHLSAYTHSNSLLIAHHTNFWNSFEAMLLQYRFMSNWILLRLYEQKGACEHVQANSKGVCALLTAVQIDSF